MNLYSEIDILMLILNSSLADFESNLYVQIRDEMHCAEFFYVHSHCRVFDTVRT